MQLPCLYRPMTTAQRRAVRLEYVVRQNNQCLHCKELLHALPSSEVQSASIDESLFPSHFFLYPVHLHHCHKTGLTIGAVHSRCNAHLWQYHGE